ncbi:MAG TPA: hypothetical protein VLL49_01715 [Anaerolineales bacterium]|nr:hypothetical protein [Anaerolineales bacterium]
MLLKDALRYELPPEGISLLGYIVRRMHKTEMLVGVPSLIAAGKSAEALRQIAGYAAAASTSFGRAFYQPSFNAEGEEVAETDPVSGALVRAKLESKVPHILVSLAVEMPDGSTFSGREEITGTTVGLRGLGMPAPSQLHYQSGQYDARLVGTITSELVLSLLGRTRIRAYGRLQISDSEGNTGTLRVERAGTVEIDVTESRQVGGQT